MFILLRKPYDIGDRISINDPNEPPGSDGVFTWFVEDVTLYYTTVRLGATNEVATISNSSLALSRIVNAARSLKAVVYITLKFGLIVPYTKIQLFKTTVESFIKARPREWLNCSAIRSTRVEADLGFIEYVIVLQHRDSWQNVDAILESKAVVVSFCLEVQKQLGMRYVAPATPVSLTLNNPQSLGLLALSHDNVSSPGCGSVNRGRTQSEDLRGLAKMFPPPYGVVDVEAT
jgi:Mechanosensitive ion channel